MKVHETISIFTEILIYAPFLNMLAWRIVNFCTLNNDIYMYMPQTNNEANQYKAYIVMFCKIV